MKKENGYLTVCIAIILPVILSLCITLIEGARQNAVRLEATCACETAVQSVMAEYHQVLRDQYDIFAIDSSYGGSRSGREQVEARLHYYMRKNIEPIGVVGGTYQDFTRLRTGLEAVEGVTILSDEMGTVFRRLAVESVAESSDLHMLEQLKEWMKIVEANGLVEGREEEKWQQADAKISEYRNLYPELEIQNPTEQLRESQRKGILYLLTDVEELSSKSMDLGSTIGGRMREGKINCGNLTYITEAPITPALEKIRFQQYLAKKMGSFGAVKEQRALDYEQEYLIAGKSSDIDNMRVVCHRLLLLREASNMMYLWNCPAKRQEVLVMAELLCGAVALPELIPIMEMALLLGWAYAEGIMDVRSLMQGGKVPLLKSDENWSLSLSAAINGQMDVKPAQEKGLSYSDYLAVFMMLEREEDLTVRAMNLIEANIRKTDGNKAFRMDACFTALEVYIRVHGAKDQQCEYQRYRKY